MGKTSSTVHQKYQDHINEIILFRYKIFTPISIILHGAFYFIDRISYSNHSDLFFQIRFIDCIVLLTFYVLAFIKPFTKLVASFTNISATVVIAGMSTMVLLGDGSSSRYYEGANLVFLAMGFINPFHFRNNALFYILQITFFELAMLLSPEPFNLVNFCFANYFMLSTALFVYIMSRLYSEQHAQAFNRQEQLRSDEAKLAVLYNSADKLSKTDELTQVANRRYFFEMMAERIRHAETNNQSFYIVMFDIDFFKQVNDSYGHAFGDEAIIHVADCVKNSIRGYDVLGRYGGDEFVLYMQQIPKEVLIKRLTIIGNNIKQIKLNCNNQLVSISVSFGAAAFKPHHGMTIENLVELADQQLLHVKKTARGGLSIQD